MTLLTASLAWFTGLITDVLGGGSSGSWPKAGDKKLGYVPCILSTLFPAIKLVASGKWGKSRNKGRSASAIFW